MDAEIRPQPAPLERRVLALALEALHSEEGDAAGSAWWEAGLPAEPAEDDPDASA